ncbi:MAG: spermidine resistance protein [Watsoniomyces obsoletus]|nr:MAG: spermidine resistance protein [Watsoniomyces obsoletus]
MGDVEMPHLNTLSPGEATPRLTIHHDATVDLDSSNAFEGPEKLLEVWFGPSPDDLPATAAPAGLKRVSTETWKEMLDLVNCKVLSVVTSEHVDAYLLSESSMFVFPHKLILKTCGTTTLLSGLPKMLEIAHEWAGFACSLGLRGQGTWATPYRVFYSRKNFLYPDKQRGPHRSWIDEVKFLDKMFVGGSAYMVGKMNGEHWYLYITGPDKSLTPPATPEWEKQVLAASGALMSDGMVDEAAPSPVLEDDETLEMLMTDLDPECAKQFHLDHASAVAADPDHEWVLRAQQDIWKGHDGGDLGNSKDEWLGSNGVHDHDEVDVFAQLCADTEGPVKDVLTTEGHVLGTVVSETSGLSDIYPSSRYPDARIDAYLFTPCGFSANGVIPAPASASSREGNTKAAPATTHYFTVHVTPESHCSYASFETNVPGRQTGRETAEVVEHVLNIFRPGRFSVTLFEAKSNNNNNVHANVVGGPGVGGVFNENGNALAAAARRSARMESIKGYRRVERIVHDLDGYDLVFRYYEREGWKGGAPPRLGEVV